MFKACVYIVACGASPKRPNYKGNINTKRLLSPGAVFGVYGKNPFRRRDIIHKRAPRLPSLSLSLSLSLLGFVILACDFLIWCQYNTHNIALASRPHVYVYNLYVSSCMPFIKGGVTRRFASSKSIARIKRFCITIDFWYIACVTDVTNNKFVHILHFSWVFSSACGNIRVLRGKYLAITTTQCYCVE